MTGYWIYTTSPVTIPLTAQGSPTGPKNLNAGWNLAGISGTSTQSAETALSGISSWSYVVSYDAGRQQYRDAGIKGTEPDYADSGEGSGFILMHPAPSAQVRKTNPIFYTPFLRTYSEWRLGT